YHAPSGDTLIGPKCVPPKRASPSSRSLRFSACAPRVALMRQRVGLPPARVSKVICAVRRGRSPPLPVDEQARGVLVLQNATGFRRQLALQGFAGLRASAWHRRSARHAAIAGLQSRLQRLAFPPVAGWGTLSPAITRRMAPSGRIVMAGRS